MEIELFGVDQANGSAGRKSGALEEAHGGTLFIDEVGRHAARNAEQDPARAGRPDVPAGRRQQQGRGRRAHHVVDRAQSRGGNRATENSARTSIIACRSCRSACRLWPSGARTWPIWSTISWTRFRRRRACRSAASATDAMAVLQSHDWPGNVRQLRNNIERLMILAGGDPDAVLNASMLPPDVGSMVPAMPNGNGGEHLMGLPLARCARGVRARISGGADQPLRRQYLAHRRVRRHGAFGAAPQAQGAWA